MYKMAAPAPHTYDEVRVVFGVFTSIDQSFTADGIQLQLVTTQMNKGTYQLGYLLDAIRIAENGVV